MRAMVRTLVLPLEEPSDKGPVDKDHDQCKDAL
jgi:hypothetical protein